MAKFKIKYNKDVCIGCMSCVSICPDNWEEDGDKVKPKKTEVDDIGCNKEAEDVCPVDAIKIEKS